MQTIIPLGNNNGALRLTTARYYTPSGKSIQAKGIVPDIEVLQDVPDDLKTRADTKGESSLRGHLKAQEGEEQTGSQSYIPPDVKNDKALNMALELLRGTKIQSGLPADRKGRAGAAAVADANVIRVMGRPSGRPFCFFGRAHLFVYGPFFRKPVPTFRGQRYGKRSVNAYGLRFAEHCPEPFRVHRRFNRRPAQAARTKSEEEEAVRASDSGRRAGDRRRARTLRRRARGVDPVRRTSRSAASRWSWSAPIRARRDNRNHPATRSRLPASPTPHRPRLPKMTSRQARP